MKVLIYGSKDFGRLVRELVATCGHECLGYIDDFAAGPDIVGTYESVRVTHPPASGVAIVIAIGYEHMAARWKVFEAVRRDGYVTPALVHPSALLHPGVIVGDGAIVMAGANVDALSRIGEATVVWPGVIVSHDTSVGANCFLSPGAILCGFVTVGDSTFVGAGAVVVDHRAVPAGSVVKAARVFS